MKGCDIWTVLRAHLLLLTALMIGLEVKSQGVADAAAQDYGMTAFIYPKASLQVAQFDPNGKMLAPLRGIQVFVFPNPAVDQVTVQLSEPIKDQIDVLISDEKGNVISNSCIAQGAVFICLPVDALPRGEYYVHIKLKDKQYTEKLLLKN
jgi:Secretion system C-terminal sorting domain